MNCTDAHCGLVGGASWRDAWPSASIILLYRHGAIVTPTRQCSPSPPVRMWQQQWIIRYLQITTLEFIVSLLVNAGCVTSTHCNKIENGCKFIKFTTTSSCIVKLLLGHFSGLLDFPLIASQLTLSVYFQRPPSTFSTHEFVSLHKLNWTTY